jgi:predicted CXXCH cytochrome family protein
MDFVNSTEGGTEFKFVSAAEQMRVSRCSQSGQGESKLGCISCHDPHRQPVAAEKTPYYRSRCLKCHGDHGCSFPEAKRLEKNKDDSCIACHMPRTGSEVTHAAITDHRILRSPTESMRKPAGERPIPGPNELAPFHLKFIDESDPEFRRNLGVALMQMQDRGLPDAVASAFAKKAIPLLDSALARDPHDLAALQAKAGALWSLKRPGEALALCELILKEWPESEVTLHAAGSLALELNRPDAARDFLERATRANPWRWQYHQGLAVASFRRGDWERAAQECVQSLRLAPASSPSRSLLIQCYLGAGHKDKAQAEFEVLQHHTPENRRHHLRQWYDEQRQRFLR